MSIEYRYLRFRVWWRLKLQGLAKKVDQKHVSKLDQIQKSLYLIALKLIHDPNSELRVSSIDHTYHIENENYLVIIRAKNDGYLINLIEYKDRISVNNFDVLFGYDSTKTLILNFEREVHKRMKNKELLKTSKVARHLQSILMEVESKQVQNLMASSTKELV